MGPADTGSSRGSAACLSDSAVGFVWHDRSQKRDNCDLDLKNIYISPTSPSLDKNFHKCADNIPILGSNDVGVRQTLLRMKKRLSGISGTHKRHKYIPATAAYEVRSDWRGAAGPAAQTAAGGDGVDTAGISAESEGKAATVNLLSKERSAVAVSGEFSFLEIQIQVCESQDSTCLCINTQ